MLARTAPTPISALLSAVLLNCAMYAVMRYDAIVSHATGPAFPHTLLLIFGLLSMLVAGLLILVQRNQQADRKSTRLNSSHT